MDVARPAAAPAHQDQVALADLAIERLGRQPVREPAREVVARVPRGAGGLARGGEQLVRRGQLIALRIEQRPEQVLQALAERPDERGYGDVAAVGRTYVPAARERERVAEGALVVRVQAAARFQRGAGELHLHLQQRADLREALGEERHGEGRIYAASSTRRNAARTDCVSRS